MGFSKFRCAAVAACVLMAAGAQAAPTVDQAVGQERAAWRERETQRLARGDDRDSLVAAVLLGMPDEGVEAVPGQAAARQRLKRKHGSDALAAFALAWSCRQASDCTSRADVDALTRLEPGNAVAWLLQPQGAAPDAATLHAAAQADHADSHLTDALRIVRAALSKAAAPAVPGLDAAELAAAFRRDAAERIPLPRLHGVGMLCKTPQTAQRDDCLALGRNLVADRSGSILFRIEGSVIVRRQAAGTPEAESARTLRREYVWMSEQVRDAPAAERERMQAETASVGEWEAWQRAAQRRSGLRSPPSDWAPADPNLLLLPEERAAR